MDPECPICLKHRGAGPLVGPVVYQDALVVVSLRADGPPGYAFVETRRHAGGLEELTAAEAAAFGQATARLARALTQELETEGVHALVAGMAVDHLHQHVYVRPYGTVTGAPWWSPAGILYGPGERESLAARLRAHLS